MALNPSRPLFFSQLPPTMLSTRALRRFYSLRSIRVLSHPSSSPSSHPSSSSSSGYVPLHGGGGHLRHSPTLPLLRFPGSVCQCSTSTVDPVLGSSIELGGSVVPLIVEEGGDVVSYRQTSAYSAIELALDSVVKIFTVSSSPNYFLPWQNKSQRETYGSGEYDHCFYFGFCLFLSFCIGEVLSVTVPLSI